MKKHLILLSTLLTLLQPAVMAGGLTSALNIPQNPLAWQEARKKYLAEKAATQSQMRKMMPLFITDQHYLARIPFFKASAGQKDVAAYFNQLKTKSAKALNLPDNLRSMDKTQQIQQARSLDLKELDFSWMKHLSEYDHFDLSQLESNQALLKQNPYTLPVLLNYPEVGSYRLWARLRLLKGYASGDLPQALRESRQLASMLLNSDSLIGSMLAVAILTDEREVFTTLKAQVPGSEPISEETLLRARRALLATSGLFLVGQTPIELFRQLVKDPDLRTGLCAGISEGTSGLAMYAMMATDFQQQANEIAQFVKTQPCRNAQTRKIWSQPQIASQAFVKSNFTPAEFQLMQKDPAYRDAVFYTLESISLPNFFSGYSKAF